jgi:hypothetical protein
MQQKIFVPHSAFNSVKDRAEAQRSMISRHIDTAIAMCNKTD